MWHIRATLIAMLGIFVLALPGGVRADSLQLKNGNMVQGKYLGGTEHAVQFEVNGKVRIYDIGGILSISFAAASADGGIPSNNVDPKPGDSTASNSEAVLHTAVWNAPRNTVFGPPPITPERNGGAARTICSEDGRPESSRSGCAVVRPNSKAGPRVSPVFAPAVRTQRQRFPVLSD
jgi:hypothetical protein